MGKKLLGGLAAVGLAIAAAFVKGIFSMGIDALGWVGLALCVGLVILIGVSALSGKSAPNSPDPPPPSAD